MAGLVGVAGVEQQVEQSNLPVQPKVNYRPEIDGLRAFAVLAVIINHFDKALLPGGYLGVDIFFVISGYVITASLAGRKSTNFADFLSGFYERRIKRLLPALMVFTLTMGVLISLVNPEPQVPMGIGIRALFGFSNIALYNASVDYFAPSTELNPFTHTWSLGVEEQFYLLFPFLIWFSGFGRQTKNGARNLFLWIGLLTLLSLAAFIYLYQASQPAAYFLMPPRFWEMAAGCLVFIGFLKRAKIEQALEKVPPLLVVAAMVAVMFLPKEAAVPATLVMVVLSAILIACLKRGTGVYRAFTNQQVVFLGLISYSLYLWHWGVLAISRFSVGIHWWSVPIQVALILLLSILSFRYIEKPFRAIKTLAIHRYIVILVGLLLSFGSAVILKLLMKAGPLLFQAALPTPQEKSTYGRSFDSTIKGEVCHVFTPDAPYNKKWEGGLPVKECSTFLSSDARRIVFVGNSYAAHLIGLQKAIHRQGIANTFNFSFGWCPFLGDSTYKRCREFGDGQSRLLSHVKATIGPGDVVVISNRFPLKEANNPGSWLSVSAMKRVIELRSYLATRGASLVIFAPSPEFSFVDPELCRPAWFRPFLTEECSMRRDVLMAERRGEWLKLRALEQAGVKVYDAMQVLCPGDQCALFDRRGKRLYFDNQHFNDYATGEIIFADFVGFLRNNQLLGASRPPITSPDPKGSSRGATQVLSGALP